jgi:hypothetical protein
VLGLDHQQQPEWAQQCFSLLRIPSEGPVFCRELEFPLPNFILHITYFRQVLTSTSYWPLACILAGCTPRLTFIHIDLLDNPPTNQHRGRRWPSRRLRLWSYSFPFWWEVGSCEAPSVSLKIGSFGVVGVARRGQPWPAGLLVNESLASPCR